MCKDYGTELRRPPARMLTDSSLHGPGPGPDIWRERGRARHGPCRHTLALASERWNFCRVDQRDHASEKKVPGLVSKTAGLDGLVLIQYQSNFYPASIGEDNSKDGPEAQSAGRGCPQAAHLPHLFHSCAPASKSRCTSVCLSVAMQRPPLLHRTIKQAKLRRWCYRASLQDTARNSSPGPNH